MLKIKYFELLLVCLVIFIIAIIARLNYQGVSYFNAGFFGGELAELPFTLRLGFHIGYITGGGVLYLYFIKNIFESHYLTRLSFHFLVSSLLSNFLEKLIFNNVFDFINLEYLGLYCNFADLVMVLSFIVLSIQLIKIFISQDQISDKRNSIFANYKIQSKLFLSVSFVLINFFIAVIFLLNIVHHDSKSLTIVISSYFFMSECILFCLLAHFSNKIVGPIEAYIRFALSNEKTLESRFSLRKNDYFRELEEVAKKSNISS